MKSIHKRSNTWNEPAFTSFDELAEFVETMEAVVRELGSEVMPHIGIECEDRDYPDLSLDELRALSTEVSFDAVTSVSVFTGLVDDQPVNARLALYRESGAHGSTTLAFSGINGGAVEGANVQGKADIDRRVGRIRQVREAVEAKAKAKASESPVTTAPKARWRRWLNHPWAVQVGGGVVAAVLAAAVLLLLR